jgi:low affinity Fe/Cu permease
VVAVQTGRPWAFALALGFIVVWLATGPIFDFSDTWQLVINTATTIVTFLMVFLIQHAQNKDSRAMELKLDELIKAISKASNRMIAIEELDDDELAAIARRSDQLVRHRSRHG